MLEKYLAEAFQSLSSLTEDVVDINDDNMESKVSDIIDDGVDDSIDVIDVNADNEDELEDSYIGKVIIECDVCHSKLYKDVEEVISSEDDETVVNVEEECPFCYSTDGYHIVGQVAPYQSEELSVDVEPIDNGDDVEEGFGDAVLSGAGGATLGGAVAGLPGMAIGGLAGAIHGAKMESLPKRRFSHTKEACGGPNNKDIFKKSVKVDESKSSSYNFLKNYYAGKNASRTFNESHDVKKCSLRDLHKSSKKDVTENFSKIDIETDTDKIKVSSQPIEDAPEQEVLAPLAPANKTKIDNNLMSDDVELDSEDIKPSVDSDVDMTDIEEESLNSVCENFFKNKSPFVESFVVSKVTESKNHLIVEGNLTFNNKCKVKTKGITFELTPQIYYPNGKCTFNVKSSNLTEDCKLKLRGTIKNKKLVTESFG